MKLLLAVVALVVALAWLSTPPPLDYMPESRAAATVADLTRDMTENLIPGTEKQLTWYADEQATEWSVVALHGFSASRQETAPLAEVVAKALGANLFETRFAGHGLQQNGLHDVTAEQWLDDVADAVTVAGKIGEKVVVIATSNGAALTMSMLDYPAMQSVDAIIVVSPNFWPADPGAKWITRPGGPLFLRLIQGPTRSWEALNEQQEKFWTTSYPSEAVIQVMRVVNRANKKLRALESPRILFAYSPHDRVISIDGLDAAFAAIRAPQKERLVVEKTGSPYNHMIVGDIISPDNTKPVAARIVEFILHPDRSSEP